MELEKIKRKTDNRNINIYFKNLLYYQNEIKINDKDILRFRMLREDPEFKKKIKFFLNGSS